MSSASVAPQKYQLFIDGQFVDSESGRPSKRRTRRVKHSPKWQRLTRLTSTKQSRLRGAHSKESGPSSARAIARTALQTLAVDRATLRGPCRVETADNGKPIKESLTSTAASGRKLRVLRRLGHEDRRRNDSRSRQDVQLHLARADRRLWSDHSVELSFVDGGVEARSRLGGRQIQSFSNPRSRLLSARWSSRS